MAPAAGSTLLGGRYQLGPLLGRGGTAEVCDGFDARLQRRVAVKRLQPALAADPEVRVRFEREARAAARLSHPAVVAIYDIGEDAGVTFLVMERMPGQTLADRIAQGPLDQEWLRRAVRQILAALTAAHAAGILHRDIKPGNVLLSADGGIKVADFGIAAITDATGGDDHHTSTGLVIGTPAYLAPERAQGRPATVQSDLYAVGVLLYEGLTGRKPYSGTTAIATAVAAQRGSAVPVEQIRPGADPTLVRVAAQAMAVRPEDRFPSAAAMAAALSAPTARAAPTAPTATAAPTLALPVVEGGRGHRGAKVVAALAATLALTGVVVGFWPFGADTTVPPASPSTTTVIAPTQPPATLAPAPPATAPVVLTPTTPTTRVRRKRHGNG